MIREDRSNDFEIEWRKLLVNRLTPVLTRLNKAYDMEQAEKIARQSEIRKLFPTAEEAHEAFGNGYITEDEWRDIEQQLDSVNENTPTSAARDELKEMLAKLRREIRDFEYSMLSDTEKDRIRRSNDEYAEKLRRATGRE